MTNARRISSGAAKSELARRRGKFAPVPHRRLLQNPQNPIPQALDRMS
ncbi:MAG: hypothetical protein ABSB35_42635 [Bryobacteraceae bacterium]